MRAIAAGQKYIREHYAASEGSVDSASALVTIKNGGDDEELKGMICQNSAHRWTHTLRHPDIHTKEHGVAQQTQ